MNNIREIIRRVVKYMLNALIVAFASNNICKTDVKNSIHIGIVSASVFVILDIVSPTISIS